MGLMQGAGIFSAIKVYCSLLPCGSLAQKFPAPAHVLSLCLFVYVGGPSPWGICKLYCWVRLFSPGFTFFQSGAWFGFGSLFQPKEFPPVVAVAVSSEQYPYKFKALNGEL